MARPDSIRSVKSQKTYVNMVLVADSGFGKTVFGGTAPKCLFLTTDPEGTLSAKAMGSDADEWPIKVFEDLDEAYCWLRDEGHQEYEWLCIDTAGGAQRVLMGSALDKSYKANPTKRDPDVPSVDVHQKVQLQIIKMTMQFNDLPMHVLWTAHPMELEDSSGNPKTLPYVHGQRGEIAQQFLGHMNVAGYGVLVEDEEGKVAPIRRMYFCHTEGMRGKDRHNKLGRYKDNLTVPAMMEIINAPRAARKSPAKKVAARRTAAAAK